VVNDSFPDEFLFLIDSFDPWYGDILVYLQTEISIHIFPVMNVDMHEHQAKHYLIVDNTMYRWGVDLILHQCLIHEEDEHVLNDCHAGACGVISLG
jgi:hypothetical protein